jgi:hypothetical protein
MRVRKGSIYVFNATGWDVFDRKENTPANGTVVRVCAPHGCPPPNAMGHCFVETLQGKFIGLVSTASLSPRKKFQESLMTREQALPYVSYAVDDALSERRPDEAPPHARLVGWQCGFEPLFVAVWSYLPGEEPPDYAEAIELATDLLVEKKWFADNDNPPEPDYVI